MLQGTSARTLRLEPNSPPRSLGQLPSPTLLQVSQLVEASQCLPCTRGLWEEHRGSHASDQHGWFLMALLTKYVLASSWGEILSTPAWKARGGLGPLSSRVWEPFSSTLQTLPCHQHLPGSRPPELGCSPCRVGPRNRAGASMGSQEPREQSEGEKGHGSGRGDPKSVGLAGPPFAQVFCWH